MKITINGEEKDLSPKPPSLENVINMLGYHPKSVVVEYNGKILTPSKWKDQEVKNKDCIEIVTIVGGGA